jgi:hypothetical protein
MPPEPPEPPIVVFDIEKSVETLLFEFLAEAKAAAPDGTLLAGAELHDTVYQVIKTNYGLRVGDAESDFVDGCEDGLVQEMDAAIVLVVYARIEGKDKRVNRAAARDKAFTLAKTVCRLIEDDSSLGGRVCDTQVLRIPRGFDSEEADTYALFHIPLIINPTGANVLVGGVQGANYA